MNLRANEKKALGRLKNILQEQGDFVDLWIFGSKAKGSSTKESDIDVMIVVRENGQALQSMVDDVVFDLNLQHDCLISAIVLSQEEIEHGPMSESPFYKAAIHDGVRL